MGTVKTVGALVLGAGALSACGAGVGEGREPIVIDRGYIEASPGPVELELAGEAYVLDRRHGSLDLARLQVISPDGSTRTWAEWVRSDWRIEAAVADERRGLLGLGPDRLLVGEELTAAGDAICDDECFVAIDDSTVCRRACEPRATDPRTGPLPEEPTEWHDPWRSDSPLPEQSSPDPDPDSGDPDPIPPRDRPEPGGGGGSYGGGSSGGGSSGGGSYGGREQF